MTDESVKTQLSTEADLNCKAMSNESVKSEESELVRVIKRLCEAHGYGRVMQIASESWRKKDPIGAISLGPCYGMLKKESPSVASTGDMLFKIQEHLRQYLCAKGIVEPISQELLDNCIKPYLGLSVDQHLAANQEPLKPSLPNEELLEKIKTAIHHCAFWSQGCGADQFIDLHKAIETLQECAALVRDGALGLTVIPEHESDEGLK